MEGTRWILLSALMLWAPRPVRPLVEDVVDVLKLTKEIGEGVFSNWKYFSGEDLQMPREKKLLGAVAQLGRNISNLEIMVQTSTSASLSALLHYIPQSTRLELRLHELSDLVARVTTAEVGMRQYAEDRESAERLTLENFAQWCVSHEPGAVPGLLERIHALVVPEPAGSGLLDRGVLALLTAALKDANSHLCNLQQSPHQLLYNMYNTIALTEIKGYTMMQFSWMLLRIYGKGNFTRESNLMRQRFVDRSTMTLAAVKSALSDASREIWRCDPQHHEEGETFVALTRLLQGYVENEVDMNSENTCRENCAYYSYAKNHGCFKDQFCSRQPPCKGKILNCQYIDSDMWICPAPRNSERRYEFIEYENQRVLGQKGSCMTGTSKVDSWWRLDLYHCSYCLCMCDESGPASDRHFSMLPVEADISQNKVVTGIRFTKVKKVIHLQISEGILLPRGKIDTASVRWRPVIPLDITDSSLEKGRDFHTMSYEERSLDLDDLDGPLGHLLTGVRFRKIGSHLNFEIRVTPFNFTTGKLISPKEKSMWISNDNTDAASHKPRTRLNLHKPDIPTRSAAASLPDSHSDQYMDFTNSDLDADAAQSTVPFLDTQAAAPLLPVPLSGAGLYHKGRKHYGGFFAPKVFTYDFSRHMEPVFPVLDDTVN